MTTLIAGFFGGGEIVLILAVVLILFGAKKLPELAKGLGQGIKEFKKATNDVQSEFQSAMDDSRYQQPQHRIDSPSPGQSEGTPPSTSTPAAADPQHKA